MTRVDRVDTPTTVNRVADSFLGCGGRAADIAIAADAPQMAVAPPDRTPKRRLKPNKRATGTDTRIVSDTAAITSSTGPQPRPMTSPMVILNPSSATPSRRIKREVKVIPDWQAWTLLTKFIAM